MANKSKKIALPRSDLEASDSRKTYRLYLDEHLKAKNWSDAVAAEKFGVAYATMYRWRKSQRELNVGKIARFAEVLEVSPEELWHPPGKQRTYQIVHMLNMLNEESIDLVVRLIQHLYVINSVKSQ